MYIIINDYNMKGVSVIERYSSRENSGNQISAWLLKNSLQSSPLVEKIIYLYEVHACNFISLWSCHTSGDLRSPG